MKEKHFHVLVDADEFMEDLEMRILQAKDRVLIQAMTFEADKAGERLYDAMKRSKAKDKTLCIDAYSMVNINDGWAYGWRYLTNSAHRNEVDSTKKILTSNEHDIHIVITNPVGLLGVKYPFRNHKKMMIVDDAVYLGGINFSEHNFTWHDFMIRIADVEVVNTLAEDFRLTCKKRNQSIVHSLTSGRLYLMDGINSHKEYEVLFDEILSAQTSITILSPYVSDPLLASLKELESHINVSIITPRLNNKSLMKNGLYDSIRGSNFHLHEYGGWMSHLKAILIDDTKLIFGSSNFDIVSYYLEQEVVMVSEDSDLVAEFKNRIIAPDMERSVKIDLRKVKRSVLSRITMSILKKIIPILARLFYTRNDNQA